MKKSKKILLISIASIVAVAIIGTVVTYSIIAKSVISGMADVRIVKNDATLEDFQLEGEEKLVQTSDGIDINIYIIPNTQSKANVILLHGMHGMDATSLFDYASFIYDAGYTPICVDMRAHGKSGGDSLSFGYLEVLDVLAVIDYIENDENLANKPIAIYGLSMGGSTAINTAAISKKVSSVIVISPFMSIQAQVSDYMSRDGASGLFIKSFMPSINAVIRSKYKVKPIKDSPLEQIDKIDTPILIVHGDSDLQTKPYQSQKLYEKSKSSNKELWIVEGADHLIVENVLDAESSFYRTKIVEWLNTIYA